ncbi:hypothetical protein AN639_11010 [Candidatus Epulonipiscium fishelsonii]|uniref:Uncharacterized protein n=1 Tax=Candidatus Epulonipiscium fishelsonii TaxID=77094 RepID=A0ACC8XCI2_9FIRM|nr:hypothetical protein AN396_05835 [Epulopiscium sp. SCG-B11WGA-EpuloA1]ONI43202.1 hypothetical protein AN639_11010 [Epulopiscium sp. SCG-B05WGA-EpuloA1]
MDTNKRVERLISFGLILLAFFIIQVIASTVWGGYYSIITSLVFLGGILYINDSKKTINAQQNNTTLEMIDLIKQDLFTEEKLPILILDKSGSIKWLNNAFTKYVKNEDLLGKNIRSLISNFQFEELPKINEMFEKQVIIDEKIYEMVINRIYEDGLYFNYGVYFLDKTEYVNCSKGLEEQKVIVGYMNIDNFDEVMQTVEEVRRPTLEAVISKRIVNWFKDLDIVITKYDKSKYIFLFKMKDLSIMDNKKFDLLDDLRNIKVGNTLPITASIGIGQNKFGLINSQEDAMLALDLALGRGGDQAIIKSGSKYKFYGGKTREVEKTTKVKSRIKAYEFKAILNESSNVYIIGHKNMDMDCLGAAIGVARASMLSDKKVNIVLDKPSMGIQSLYERMMKSEEYKDIFITKETALKEITKETLVVIVDVHRKSYLEVPELLDKAEKVVIFDHHRKNTDFIDDAILSYIEPYVSSTCEMITEILYYIGDKVKLTELEADALLAGITMDTKNFVSKTGVRTFEAAAVLRRAGANSTRVRLLFQDDMETYQIRAQSIKNAELWQNNMAIASVESDHPNANIIAAQVADELLNIKGIEASFVFSIRPDHLIISARSLENFNVQRIMELLGGGGHRTIAGAQMDKTEFEEGKAKLKNSIEKYLEEIK